MALIDVVKWDAQPNELVWKYPSEELSTATRLIVSATQEAVVVLGGQISAVFGPGTHILDTDNIPFLRTFIKIPFGNRTPYAAEVWFVQKTTPLDLLWGTLDPVPVMDPKFGVPVPLRCHGQFGIQVADSHKFFLKFVGTTGSFDTEKLKDYFKALIQSRVKSLIAQEIVAKNCSIFELGQYLDVFSSEMEGRLQNEFLEFGVSLINFFIQSINFPQDDPVVASLKESLAKRADMRVVGYTYTQERSFDVLQGAAQNEGVKQKREAVTG